MTLSTPFSRSHLMISVEIVSALISGKVKIPWSCFLILRSTEIIFCRLIFEAGARSSGICFKRLMTSSTNSQIRSSIKSFVMPRSFRIISSARATGSRICSTDRSSAKSASPVNKSRKKRLKSLKSSISAKSCPLVVNSSTRGSINSRARVLALAKFGWI